MPTETPKSQAKPQFVQVPAPKDGAPAKDIGVIVDPNVNYDLHRGKGGDYIVNDEGHRVPLHEHKQKQPK